MRSTAAEGFARSNGGAAAGNDTCQYCLKPAHPGMYYCDARPQRPGLRKVRTGHVPSYTWLEEIRDERGNPEHWATPYGGNIIFYISKINFF